MMDVGRQLATLLVMPLDLNQPDVPKHVQLAGYIRARIDDGTYPPKSRIPSEIHWVQETGFARDTVRKAMQVLIEENRVYVVRGLGTFVGERAELEAMLTGEYVSLAWVPPWQAYDLA